MADHETKRKIFALGGNGLVGSRIAELLSFSYHFDNLSSSTGVDITRPETLTVLQNDTEHDTVILFAAKTDVDGCEKDRELGKEGDAWRINVEGVRNVVNAVKGTQKKLIYVSTDFVFGGDDTPEGGYTEESTPNPKNWYAVTKYEGEKIVQESSLEYLILRIAYPYRSSFPKVDFVRGMLNKLKDGFGLSAIEDHIYSPTFIDDIANALDKLIRENATHIYHVTGTGSLTPYDAAKMIAKEFGFKEELVGKTTREEFFKDRAPRPYNLTMNNGKIGELGVTFKSFEEGLTVIKQQMENI